MNKHLKNFKQFNQWMQWHSSCLVLESSIFVLTFFNKNKNLLFSYLSAYYEKLDIPCDIQS